MKNNFNPSRFFDSSSFPFKDLFEGVESVWEVLSNIEGYIQEELKAKDKKDIYIGEGSVIQGGALIQGPVIIGRNCFIGHGALLRQGCILGDNVHIGHAVEVKHSILLNHATIAHLNYVGDSIVGKNVNVSGGTMLANFRLDKKPIVIKIGDQRVETGLSKLGAIIGDNSNIGVNAVLNPGTILGKNTVVYPLVSVTGVHKDGEVIK